MALSRNRPVIVGAVLALLLFAVALHVWAGTMFAASGGTAISADTALKDGTGAWTSLDGPTYRENINGDIANGGSVTLTVPAGFAFNLASNITVRLTAGDRNPAANMNEAAVGAAVASTATAINRVTVTATTISFFVNSKSRGNTLNIIEWEGIQVRPLQGTPLASGNILLGLPAGSAFSSSTNAGTLTVVPGALARLLTILPGQTYGAGTGITGTALAQTAGTSFNLQLVATDRFNNRITTYSGSKEISYAGPASGCSLAPSYTGTVNFTNGSSPLLTTRLSKSETVSITASEQGVVSGPASSMFAVVPAPMSQLVVTLPGQTFAACAGNAGTPSNQLAGVSFNILSITATDAYFNVVTGYAGTKNIVYTGPTGPRTVTTPVSFAAGRSTTTLATTISTAQTTSITVGDGAIAGPASAQFEVTSSVNNFDGFETATPPGALTGVIKTKIAGTAFSLDIVALTSTPGVSDGFAGKVNVAIVDGASGSCGTHTEVQVLPAQTFSAGAKGRVTITGITEAKAWKNVRLRISYPDASPPIVSCSRDNFSIRPDRFTNAVAKDVDETTPGMARTLNNTLVPGGVVHKAGQPFTIAATAVASSGAATKNYVGAPAAIVSQCSLGDVCPPVSATAVLAVSTWALFEGTLSTDNARYSDVGSVALVLQDQSFADVDTADSSPVERTISSATFIVGRFVPDHYFATAIGIVPRTDLPSCSASTFTYMDEPVAFAYSLVARNAAPANATIGNYKGSLATLDVSLASHLNFGAIDSVLKTPLTPRISVTKSEGSWKDGKATVSSTLILQRLPDADGPFNNAQVGIAPRDPDGVTLAQYDLDADANAINERQLLGTTRFLNGRLRLGNAYGNELLNLRIPLQTQFWSGASFRQNTQDNCTVIASAANVVLANHLGGITALNMKNPDNVALGGPFTAGLGSLVLKKPLSPPKLKGSVDMTINLDAETKSYLKPRRPGTLTDTNPASRATFGLFKAGPVIYSRETY